MRKIVTNRKGQLAGLSSNVILLGVAAIALILFLVILQGMRDVDVVKKANSQTILNETLTTVAETGENLANYVLPGALCTVLNVYNASSGTVIASTNYTQTNCNLAFTAGISEGFNNSNWNVSYGVTFGDEAYTAGNETLVGLGTFGDFWTIIVLAIVAALVIGIILGGFSLRGRR
jgi:hypothetical protein